MELSKRVRKIMMSDRLMFVYRGVVNKENSEPLLLLLEKEMEESEFAFAGRKRLFMFVLESLQNVSRHTEANNIIMSLVVYSKKENGYTVTTANGIDSNEEPELRRQLDLINSLNVNEVRKLFREKLNNTTISSKGGAGLGLIEMAKKTGNKLDYDFVKNDVGSRYFVLSKTVDLTGRSINTGGQTIKYSGSNMMILEQMMYEHRILMMWSGHLSSDIKNQVLSFPETAISETNNRLKIRQRVFSIMVECMQNISKFNPGFEVDEKLGVPIAMIISEQKGISLKTSNIILNSKVQEMEGMLLPVKKQAQNDQKNLFEKSELVDDIYTDKIGLAGLIDIAQKSGYYINYKFEKKNNTHSYYWLSILVDVKGKDIS